MTSARPAKFDWPHAIDHPYRVEIMRRFLATDTATPTEIADALMLPIRTVSYHIHCLTKWGILRLVRRTQRRGAWVHHYRLADRERTASLLWTTRATLLVTDAERETGTADATVRLDPEGLRDLRALTAAYLARIGELGLQTCERRSGDTDDARAPALTTVAVLLATDEGGAQVAPAWQ